MKPPTIARPPYVMPAEDVPLDVLFEDAELIVVNKPAGMVVHPTYKHPGGTLMNALSWRARDWPAPQRPSLVGRLDKLTSGLVVVAKSPEMHAALQRELMSERSEKDYLAIVRGRVDEKHGRIESRLSRDTADRRRVVASVDVGALSVTLFERMQVELKPDPAGNTLTLIRCRLVTGRMHQIRVHLASKGWPIYGDATYGAAEAGFPRHALHARRIAFTHPTTRRRVEIEAPIPDDLRAVAMTVGLEPDPTES